MTTPEEEKKAKVKAATDAANTQLSALSARTGKAEPAVKTELKEKVAAALRASDNPADIANAIKEVVNKHAAPKTDEDKAKLETEAKAIGEALIKLKKEGGVDAAINTFNSSVDRAELPLGMMIGGAAGLAAALGTDIGDWSSFGGIMQKLALIAVGVGAGELINNDMGARDRVTGMFTGPKPPEAGKAPGK